MNELWTVKHSPKKLAEITGNPDAVEKIKAWALDWERGKKQKPLLIHGPTGTGKTAAAVALAREMDWILVETDASESRKADMLQKKIGAGCNLQSLSGCRKLLLIDEADAAFDRGQIPAIIKIIRESTHPAMVIVEDLWNPKLSALRNECVKIQFKRINWLSVNKRLKEIAKTEEWDCEFTEEIARNANGDLRSAIVDLQSAFKSDSSFIGNREREEDVFKVLVKILKTTDFNEAIQAGDSADVDLEMLLRWIEENIPREYTDPQDTANAFEQLSRADVFTGRIRSRQDYGLQKYSRALGLGGVALAKKQKYSRFTPYQFPSIIKKLSETKKNRALARAIGEKAGAIVHASSRDAFQQLVLVGHEKYWDSFGLNEEEKSFLGDLQELDSGNNDKNRNEKPNVRRTKLVES
ncbi:MAG: replication factor C large subunit [Candidatus Micrarchaeota archaeon]